MIFQIGALGIGAAVALTAMVIGNYLQDRNVVRDSLRQLDGGFENESQRDEELLAPLAQRAFGPVINTLVEAGRRYSPSGYIESVKVKLSNAGETDPKAIDRHLLLRVLGIAAVPFVVLAFWVFNVVPLGGLVKLGAFVISMAILVKGADISLDRKVEKRQHTMLLALPDVLDLLTISVEAGLGFEQALDRVVGAMPGELSDEFSRYLGETAAGASRADALRALDERIGLPEVRAFVMALLQADKFGVSIGQVLRAQADDMRIRRRQAAQERAMKAPVKMLIPMVFCIFPLLFIVVIGPAVINISQNF